jgi:hypothetical protein
MAVNWNLAGGGFNALQTLQAFGAAQQERLQQQALDMKRAEQQRTMYATQAAAGRAAAGDYRGAQQVAAAAGDFDLAGQIQRLDAGQRERLKAESEAIGRVAYSLSQLPQEQRAAALQQAMPALRAAGISDQEIASADLSDGGLRGYIAMATSIGDQFRQSQPDYQTVPFDATLVNTRDPQALREFQQRQQQGQTTGLSVGTVSNGYRYIGGNPNDRNNWQPLGGAPSQGGASFP